MFVMSNEWGKKISLEQMNERIGEYREEKRKWKWYEPRLKGLLNFLNKYSNFEIWYDEMENSNKKKRIEIIFLEKNVINWNTQMRHLREKSQIIVFNHASKIIVRNKSFCEIFFSHLIYFVFVIVLRLTQNTIYLFAKNKSFLLVEFLFEVQQEKSL